MRFFLLLPVLLAVLLGSTSAAAQPPVQSEECLKASKQCEENTDCIHRLAVLQSACVTNTCQRQCRDSAMNLYQNREGRVLLRTDASCVPGRYELEKCGLLPLRSPKHCQLAKLICETDLQCNSKWEVFISECEAETAQGRCSPQCRLHLNNTLATYHGAGLQGCICTDKDDNRCVQLRDFTLRTCLQPVGRRRHTAPHAPAREWTTTCPTSSKRIKSTSDRRPPTPPTSPTVRTPAFSKPAAWPPFSLPSRCSFLARL
ncbi:GDNF/GAS1 domain-containing protein [Aphelenchoides fujianensis]|nr:GDNF/GAS1 domain-containing protein [Aphelenchoides fujianensis]